MRLIFLLKSDIAFSHLILLIDLRIRLLLQILAKDYENYVNGQASLL